MVLTATVSPVSPGTGTPTGTVTFKDGATPFWTSTLVAGTTAIVPGFGGVPALSLGTRSITAVYNGNFAFNATGATPGSTATTVNQVVNKMDTTTSVTSNVNPSTIGQNVTFTATVSVVPPGAGTPTGTVTFKDGGDIHGVGGTVLWTGTLNGSAQATFSTPSLSAGHHSITAVYSGDGTFNATGATTGSTATLYTQQVHYNFIGFLPPVDNLPTFNSVKAGQTIPIKWQLKDNAGNIIGDLGTLAPNGLTSARIDCAERPA